MKKFPKKILDGKGLFLAPMLGYTDMAMRKVCHEYGADYCFTEMISAHSIFENKEQTIKSVMDTADFSVPTGLQIFTSKAEYLEKALIVLKNMLKKEHYKNISSICINLGCPHVKNSGAFLLNNFKEIEKMFQAMKKHSALPICAKIRLGIKRKNYKKIVQLSNKYLDFLIVHGRTKEQLYHGENDLDAIREIKKISKIPVVGNGDVKDYESAKKMLDETKCDAIMLGRAALKQPWVFKEIRSGKKLDSCKERGKTLKKYLEYSKKYKSSVIHFKAHLLKLLPKKEGKLKDKIIRCKNSNDIRKFF